MKIVFTKWKWEANFRMMVLNNYPFSWYILFEQLEWLFTKLSGLDHKKAIIWYKINMTKHVYWNLASDVIYNLLQVSNIFRRECGKIMVKKMHERFGFAKLNGKYYCNITYFLALQLVKIKFLQVEHSCRKFWATELQKWGRTYKES